MTLRIETLDGPALAAAIDDVARLRIAVFRDWPYLYDGSLDYERRYLRPYLDSPGAVVVGAFDGETLVGAATGTPMADHAAEFVVNGTYLKTDGALPEAKGQTYVLPAGSFFTLTDGRISRVTTYYNLADWLRQVKG